MTTMIVPDCSTRDHLAQSLVAAFSGSTPLSRGWATSVTSTDGVLEVRLTNLDNAFDVRLFTGGDTPETYALLQEHIGAYDWLPMLSADEALMEILDGVLDDVSPDDIADYVGPYYREGFGEAGGADDGVVVAVPRGTHTFVIGAWSRGGEVIEHMRLPLSDLLGLAGVTLADCQAALEAYAQQMANEA